MKMTVIHRNAARQDLATNFRHYAREAGMSVADRFLATAEAVSLRLSEMPNSGTLFRHDHPALAEVRFLPLSSPFNRFLLFYRPLTDSIEIVRILHGSRDIHRILSTEFGLDDNADDGA